MSDIFSNPNISRFTKRILMTVALAAIVFFQGNAQNSGNVYYVGPNGDDEAPGTEQTPWASLEQAGKMAKAGDKVIILPGSYEGTLAPQHSGTYDEPIIFKADERRTVRFEGGGKDPYPIRIEQVEHILLEGFHVDPVEQSGRWLLIEDSEHIIVADCLFEHGYGSMPFHIVSSRNIWVMDSVLRKNAFNMARISYSEQVVFEGNAISRAGHSPLQIFPPGSNSKLVLRGNVFHAAWGRPFEFFTTRMVLFENNIITNAYNSGRSASSNAKFAVQEGIFRFNRVFRNPGGAIDFYSWADDPMETIRVYHNVFHKNAHYGLRVRGVRGGVQSRDILFTNNIFAENDPHGAWTQLRVDSGSPESVSFRSNVFWGPEKEWDDTINWDGKGYGVAAVEKAAWREKYGEVFKDNVENQPGFADADQYHHSLGKRSLLRNAGTSLTRTRDDGEGTILPVTDASVFFDGFGIPGESGDIIAVGETLQQARVLEVRQRNGEIVLDRMVTWKDGDPVSFPWGGSNPDVGAFEHERGRPSVEIRATPFEALPGEPVTLELMLRGIPEVNSIQWRLGDGTLVENETSIIHKYADAYDYPIRVRVEDDDGRVHRGTGYIVVKEAEDPAKPLLHSTFSVEDEEWWWRWQSYRPAPAAWERVLVLEEGEETPPPWSHPRGDNRVIPHENSMSVGSGWLRAYAPENGSHLPAWVHPRYWNLDTHPRIRIRYRLEPGTPVGVYIRAFPIPDNTQREVWLAVSSASARAGDNPELPRLIDDGKWHDLELDARIIRSYYPDVDVLEGLRFWSEDPDRVKKDHALELDEVLIMPGEK